MFYKAPATVADALASNRPDVYHRFKLDAFWALVRGMLRRFSSAAKDRAVVLNGSIQHANKPKSAEVCASWILSWPFCRESRELQ